MYFCDLCQYQYNFIDSNAISLRDKKMFTLQLVCIDNQALLEPLLNHSINSQQFK